MIKTLIFPKHDNGTRDNRYSAEWEYIGHPKKRLVVRWCGDFVGNAENVAQANRFMRNHRQDRNDLMEKVN